MKICKFRKVSITYKHDDDENILICSKHHIAESLLISYLGYCKSVDIK